MYEQENINIRTEKFFQEVIDTTIDQLSWNYAENGLSEDLCDRIKASWEKKLREQKLQNINEAERKFVERSQQQIRACEEAVDEISRGAPQ